MMHAKVRKGKTQEMIQTFSLLREKVLSEKGCLTFDLYRNAIDESDYILLQEWESYRDMERHIRSAAFTILHGAMTTLSDNLEIRFDKVTLRSGPEMIELVRQR